MLFLLIAIVQAQVNPLLYKWGTYKPQMIHCITERNIQTYNPLTITFYYFLNQKVDWEKSIKYKINERSQEDIVYHYQLHDGERFSVHETIDPEYKLHLTNEFYKLNPEKIEDWTTTVVNNGYLHGDDDQVSLVYSIAIEKLNPEKSDLRKLKVEEEGGSLKITITTAQQVNYIYISLLSNNQKIELPISQNFGYAVYYQNPILNYNLRSLLYQELKKITNQQDQSDEIQYKLNKQVDTDQGNVVFVQYVGRRNEFFKFQLRYMTREIPISSDYYFDYRILKKLDSVNFLMQYNKTFNTVDQILNPFYQSCSKSSFVNLLGGFATSFGNLTCEEADTNCQANKMMFTPTPSRYGFPRPFLWDDGFHNMIVCRWRPNLCIQTLLDWFDTINSNGWIPREQARSPEQKAAVPSAFLAQKKSETNPPTFMFNIIYLDCISQTYLALVDKNAEIQQQIRKMWPKISDWYHFWIKSQTASEQEHSFLYKWWGKNENINFGSGMDDWPRSNNGIKSKYNIDASIWAWFFADGMQKLSAIYDPQHKDQYHLTADSIRKAIRKHHFDQSDRIFKDVLIDNSFSPHLGYPNLLPLAFGFIDGDDQETLNAYVQMMKEELWSNHGLRSLSPNDHHFGKGDNYWTGPVWIPINYLVLRGIYKYYQHHEDLMILYQDLRNNLMETVCVNWRESSYFYEHYNQKLDGSGRGYHPFNGWTSTITLIINEIYD